MLGDGLIVDFSRHNRQITALDLERCTVRVGAGVVLDQLNALLKPHGFCFGPDVATSSRATLGGMIANNPSGAHVPVYGTTAGHLRTLEIVLADGRIETIGPGHPALADETGCCGMAGAFGMLAEKYELSLQVAAPLVECVTQQSLDAVVIGSGTSCRHQITDLTPVRPKRGGWRSCWPTRSPRIDALLGSRSRRIAARSRRTSRRCGRRAARKLGIRRNREQIGLSPRFRAPGKLFSQG